MFFPLTNTSEKGAVKCPHAVKHHYQEVSKTTICCTVSSLGCVINDLRSPTGQCIVGRYISVVISCLK